MVPIPQELTGGNKIHLGQPFSEVKKGRRFEKTGLWGDYYESGSSRYFMNVFYEAEYRRLKNISMKNHGQISAMQLHQIVDLLNAEYGVEGVATKNPAKGYTIWKWNVSPGIIAEMSAVWGTSTNVAEPEEYLGTFLYIGPSD